MKATFALLADRPVSNLVRGLSWQLHQVYQTGTIGSRLPPHVSLKQPFQSGDLPALADYMADFARSVRPFAIELTEFQLVRSSFEGQDMGIMWIEAQESRQLRGLHERLNRELGDLFGNTQADHDGPDYHFHLTVAMGLADMGMYERMFADLQEKRVGRSFIARELAMFVYDEPLGPQAEFMTYRILSLGLETPGRPQRQ